MQALSQLSYSPKLRRSATLREHFGGVKEVLKDSKAHGYAVFLSSYYLLDRCDSNVSGQK
jgi:hypothetical protein